MLLVVWAFMSVFYIVMLSGAALVATGYLVNHLVKRSRERRPVAVPESLVARLRPALSEDELKAA